MFWNFQVVCFNDISMALRCPVLVSGTASVNGFCILSVSVPVSVDTANMIAPYWQRLGYFRPFVKDLEALVKDMSEFSHKSTRPRYLS